MINSKYQAFLTVAEVGNITRAAECLGYTQSGVSHLITALETEVGLPLLIRSKTGTALTPEGEAILPYIRKVLEAEQNLTHMAFDLRGVNVGELRIGTFSSVAINWLPGLLARFKELYPGVEISIFNGDYAQVEDRLMRSEIDCGFVTMSSRKEFEFQKIMNDRLLAIVPASSQLGSKLELQPTALAEETFIVPAEGSNYDIGKVFAQSGTFPKNQLAINDDYAAVEMVRRGLGVTILPELMVANLPMDGLCAIPLLGFDREIGLAVLRSRYLSPAVREFVSCVKDYFST